MATNFPTSLDNPVNPSATGGDRLDSATVPHDAQHANANDAIKALEVKVGIDGGSGVTSTTPLFIGPSAPSSPPTKYLWMQTGLGTGTDFELWLEDGLP